MQNRISEPQISKNISCLSHVQRVSFRQPQTKKPAMIHSNHSTKSKFLAFVALVGLSVATSSAQIIISNSLATYTYEQNPANSFVPSSPIAPASGTTSTLSFFPSGFSAGTSGSAWNIDSETAVLTATLNANPGLFFVDALTMNSQVNYSLVAPTSTSSAGISASAPFTLYVTEVDGVGFGTTLQLTDTLVFAPSVVEATGPSSFLTGSLTGTISLSLNTIKTHFGIGPASNITGMRVQFSPSISAWSERGSATASLVNVDISSVVPEPSTYALLAMAAAGLGAHIVRRRRR
jgi:hypothetical protein